MFSVCFVRPSIIPSFRPIKVCLLNSSYILAWISWGNKGHELLNQYFWYACFALTLNMNAVIRNPLVYWYVRAFSTGVSDLMYSPMKKELMPLIQFCTENLIIILWPNALSCLLLLSNLSLEIASQRYLRITVYRENSPPPVLFSPYDLSVNLKLGVFNHL